MTASDPQPPQPSPIAILLQVLAAIVVGLCGVGLFTDLKITGQINDASYVALIGLTVVASFALLLYHRLKELDLKNLKLVLQEAKQVKEEVDVLRQQVAAERAAVTAMLERSGPARAVDSEAERT